MTRTRPAAPNGGSDVVNGVRRNIAILFFGVTCVSMTTDQVGVDIDGQTTEKFSPGRQQPSWLTVKWSVVDAGADSSRPEGPGFVGIRVGVEVFSATIAHVWKPWKVLPSNLRLLAHSYNDIKCQLKIYLFRETSAKSIVTFDLTTL